jgi:hypothetical protein
MIQVSQGTNHETIFKIIPKSKKGLGRGSNSTDLPSKFKVWVQTPIRINNPFPE